MYCYTYILQFYKREVVDVFSALCLLGKDELEKLVAIVASIDNYIRQVVLLAIETVLVHDTFYHFDLTKILLDLLIY